MALVRTFPRLRDLDHELRRRRLVTARFYAPRSVPRIAILLGMWDAGEVVRTGVRAKHRRGKVKHG